MQAQPITSPGESDFARASIVRMPARAPEVKSPGRSVTYWGLDPNTKRFPSPGAYCPNACRM